MKKVLFIAHHFPPMGGPGVHRSLRFVTYLPGQGYLPIVLTITLEDVKNGPYPIDDTLLNDLPKEVEIVRVATGEPRRIKRFLGRIRLFRLAWFFFYPIFWESSALWPFMAYATAKKLIKEHDIKLVYTSSSPFSAMLLGLMLKLRLKVKWVADLRDPFTDAQAWLWPSKWHWYFCRWMEKIVFPKTDRLIVNTPETKKLYSKRKLCQADNIEVLPNGF